MRETPPIVKKSDIPASWMIYSLLLLGMQPAELAKHSELSEAQILSPSLVMPIELFNEILDWSAEKLCDEALGISITQHLQAESFGVLGNLARNAPTVKDWCMLLEKYHNIFTQTAAYRYYDDGPVSGIRLYTAPLAKSEARHDIDIGLATVVRGIRLQTSNNWKPIRCSFTYKKPECTKKHEYFFGPNLSFEASVNDIAFPEGTSTLKVVDAEPKLLKIFLQQANHLLTDIESKDDLTHHLKLLITAGLGNVPVNTVTAASGLNLSISGLHRRLKEEGTTFKEVRDQVIASAAREALQETKAPITHIAFKLGFSEASAFIRAFKRLEGVTPLQFRKNKH